LSRIESDKEFRRRQALHQLPNVLEPLSSALAQKLIDDGLVETTSKNSLQDEFSKVLDNLSRMEEFDINYKVAPLRRLVREPHVVSLYLTAWIVEDLVNHKDVIDIFGDDLDVYQCVNKQVARFLN
jgi:hypothetical protein